MAVTSFMDDPLASFGVENFSREKLINKSYFIKDKTNKQGINVIIEIFS